MEILSSASFFAGIHSMVLKLGHSSGDDGPTSKAWQARMTSASIATSLYPADILPSPGPLENEAVALEGLGRRDADLSSAHLGQKPDRPHAGLRRLGPDLRLVTGEGLQLRSEERRVGKECRYWWARNDK